MVWTYFFYDGSFFIMIFSNTLINKHMFEASLFIWWQLFSVFFIWICYHNDPAYLKFILQFCTMVTNTFSGDNIPNFLPPYVSVFSHLSFSKTKLLGHLLPSIFWTWPNHIIYFVFVFNIFSHLLISFYYLPMRHQTGLVFLGNSVILSSFPKLMHL